MNKYLVLTLKRGMWELESFNEYRLAYDRWKQHKTEGLTSVFAEKLRG